MWKKQTKADCKAVKILEFGKSLTVESGKQGKFGLWNLESWALESRIHFKESGFPLMIGFRIQVPLKKTGIQYLESGIQGVESRIQDCFEFPYMGGIKLWHCSPLKTVNAALLKLFHHRLLLKW